MAPAPEAPEDTSPHAPFTEDAFLSGRLTVRQPQKGYRAGIEPVFLAAAVPARDGEHVLEAGCGAGVASLCLAARVGGVTVDALEIQPAAAALAAENARLNALDERVHVVEGDIACPPRAIAGRQYAHGFANPPFYEEARHPLPPEAGKRRSHDAAPTPLEVWVDFLCRRVRPGGTVTLIHRAEALGALLTALEARTGSIQVLPLWPRAGKPARRVLVQARLGGKAELALLPGLVLHGEGNAFTDEAQAILRHGAPLALPRP